MTFKNKCCRCGFCCLSENCKVAQEVFKIPRFGVLCPALVVGEQVTGCGAVAVFGAVVMGIGAGCCIKARAVHAGVSYDFAALPDEVKHGIFRRLYGQKYGGKQPISQTETISEQIDRPISQPKRG